MIKLEHSGCLVELEGIRAVKKHKNGFDKARVYRSIIIRYADSREVVVTYRPDDEYHVVAFESVPTFNKDQRDADFKQLEDALVVPV